MTRGELRHYIEATVAVHRPTFFVDRLFRTNEEWDRISAYEIRNVSLSSTTEASLDDVLTHRTVVLLGEPGSGKSTVARAAVETVAAKGWVPLVGSLRSYTGDLATLLASGAPAALIVGEPVDGAPVTRVLILDGFDEIRHEQLDRFVADLTANLQRDATLRLLLTARQAFYEANRGRFASPPEAFYLLGFTDRNIRQYVDHGGGGYDAFMQEVNRVGVGQEIANPFALETLFHTFTKGQSLGRLRHEAVSSVVESLIARPAVTADRQRRALRMLAIAMETAARNELTLDEAVLLLRSAMKLSARDAEALLHELTNSILVRTTNGISFQMRSYGEYLAAVELSDRSLDRVQLLVRYEDSLILNESWRNCISYLAELHTGVRRHFSLTHPDWMMSVSPAAFSDAERTEVLTRLVDQLATARRYLWHHPAISITRAARFITPEFERQLWADAAGADVVRAGNAIVLLGATAAPDIVRIALPIALDRTLPHMLRGSAVAGLAHAGDSTLVPALVAGLDENDQLHLSLLDCIGSLTDAASIPMVLPLLVRTDAMISGAYYRFRELQNRAAVDQFLSVLATEPGMIQSSRLDAYAKPLWEALAEFWEPRWSAPLARLIVRWETSHVYERQVESLTDALRQLGTRGEELVRLVLQELLAGDHRPFAFRLTVSRMVTPEVAEWLSAQPNATHLMQIVATLGSPAVRAVLAPHLGGFVELQDVEAVRREQEDQRRAASERRQLEERQSIVQSSSDFPQVLGRLSRLDAKDWPDLDAERTVWMSEQVQSLFRVADPVRTTVWHNDNQLTYQNVLPLLVRITDRYGFHLADDRPLVQSLLALESHHIASCHRRHPFSAVAISELERILADPTTPSGAIYNLLGFLTTAEVRTDLINSALVAIVEDQSRPEHIRSWAIRCCGSSATEQQLVALSSRLAGTLKDALDDALVERQHRPTIERRLAGILGNPERLRAGEVEFPQESRLSWIGKIATTEVWPSLVQLRQESLRLALPNVATLITATMQRIDGLALAEVVRQQVQLAPPSWQEGQHLRAFEIERDTRLRNAQGTPFDEIMHRLRRATTLGLFKIWCEGPTDAPTVQEFVAKLPGANRLDIVTDSLKGWTAVMNPAWTADRLADGCHDLIVILDGDKARDWVQPRHPFKPAAQRVLDKLTAAGVDFVVLERYGIENYFSQTACETVLRRGLVGMFPLPPYEKVQLPNHAKGDNPAIARAMDLADLANTDLYNFLQTVENRSRV